MAEDLQTSYREGQKTTFFLTPNYRIIYTGNH